MTLLQMSLSGALMILTVALIRALAMHRLPKRLFPALWGVVLARLLIPFSLPSPLSLFRLLRPATDAAPIAKQTAAPVAETFAARTAMTAVGDVPEAAARGAALSGADPWPVIWLIGLALASLYFLSGYVLHRRRFRESLPVSCEFVRAWLAAHPMRRRVQARQTDRIAAPLTYGVLRPVILLPSRTDWADEGALDCVLAHEWTHIRRNDALFKPLLIAAACVHWFNPLAWAMLALANRDLELACDEQVVLSRGRDSRRSYALALIRMEERRHGPSPLYSHFSRTAIEERITAIMKTGNRSRIATALALLMMLSAFTAFATSAPQPTAAGASPDEPLPTPLPTSPSGGDSDGLLPTPTSALPADDFGGASDAGLSVICRPGESVGYAGDGTVRIDLDVPEHDSYFFLLTVSNAGDAERQVHVDRIAPLFPKGLTFSVGPGALQSAFYLGDLDGKTLPLTLRSSGDGWDFWPTLCRVRWLDDLSADLSGNTGGAYAISVPEATTMRFTYRATDGSCAALYSDGDPEWQPFIRAQDGATEADVTLTVPAGNLIIRFFGNGLLRRR